MLAGRRLRVQHHDRDRGRRVVKRRTSPPRSRTGWARWVGVLITADRQGPDARAADARGAREAQRSRQPLAVRLCAVVVPVCTAAPGAASGSSLRRTANRTGEANSSSRSSKSKRSCCRQKQQHYQQQQAWCAAARAAARAWQGPSPRAGAGAALAIIAIGAGGEHMDGALVLLLRRCTHSLTSTDLGYPTGASSYHHDLTQSV